MIVQALPHLSVIGWATISEDRAAAAFSRGFYDALGRGCAGGSPSGTVSIAEAYASAEAAFRDGGFTRADPEGPLGHAAHGYYDMLVSRIKPARRGSAPPLQLKLSTASLTAYQGDGATYGRKPAGGEAADEAPPLSVVRISRIKSDPPIAPRT